MQNFVLRRFCAFSTLFPDQPSDFSRMISRFLRDLYCSYSDVQSVASTEAIVS